MEAITTSIPINPPQIRQIENAQIQHSRAYKQAKKNLFIEAFRQTGSTSAAAKAVKISREVVYLWKNTDEDFARAFKNADTDVTDLLEQVAIERAVCKSDGLLMFLLRARRPEKYRESRQCNAVDEAEWSNKRYQNAAELLEKLEKFDIAPVSQMTSTNEKYGQQ